MFDNKIQIIIDDYSSWSRKVFRAALEKAQIEIELEELEFNGRWYDDGGRNVE